VKILLFSNNAKIIKHISVMLKESQLTLKTAINRSPIGYDVKDEIIQNLEHMFAVLETDPFHLTVVSDAKTMLEETDFEDWLVIYIDMQHQQARDVIQELARRKISQRFTVIAVIKHESYDKNADNISFASSWGCVPFWEDIGPEEQLSGLSGLLSSPNLGPSIRRNIGEPWS